MLAFTKQSSSFQLKSWKFSWSHMLNFTGEPEPLSQRGFYGFPEFFCFFCGRGNRFDGDHEFLHGPNCLYINSEFRHVRNLRTTASILDGKTLFPRTITISSERPRIRPPAISAVFRRDRASPTLERGRGCGSESWGSRVVQDWLSQVRPVDREQRAAANRDQDFSDAFGFEEIRPPGRSSLSIPSDAISVMPQ